MSKNRKELYNPTGRLIPIQIYFPTQKGVHIPQEKIFENHAPKKWKPLEIKVFSHKKDLSFLAHGKHPLIILNHGDTVAMTDYASISEDLASHGYIVVAIQHQLTIDQDEPSFLKERSISRYSLVINNIFFVFEWSKKNQLILFHDKIDLQKLGLIGHSMGGNALLLLANRASNILKIKDRDLLLPHNNPKSIHECIIVLDTGGFPYPHHKKFPLLLLLSEEREQYQKKTDTYAEIIKLGHQVKYYKGSKHISFMDHGYIDPPQSFKSKRTLL